MNRRKCLIFGNSSFLAKTLIDVLKERNWIVRSTQRTQDDETGGTLFLDASNPDFRNLDLEDFDFLVNCISLGVQSGISYKMDQLMTPNVNFPIYLIEYLDDIQYKGTLVSFGSYFEIGMNGSNKAYSEDDILVHNNRYINKYALTKRLLTKYVSQVLTTKKSFKLWHLVLPTIFGKGEHPNRLIPYLLEQLDKGLRPKLSSGHQTRQYIDVRNVAAYFLKITEASSIGSGIYNMPSDRTGTIRSLVGEIVNIKGIDAHLDFGDIAKQDEGANYLALDFTKLDTLVNYNKKISFKESILSY